MRTCVPTANSPRPARRAGRPDESGFTLIEMLVAMLILSLVGLTLARFQTFQLKGTASLATTAAARLAADNLAIDLLVAPGAPLAPETGSTEIAGRQWYWAVTPAPSPDPVLMPDLVRLDVSISAEEGGAPIATRSLLRPRGATAVAARP